MSYKTIPYSVDPDILAGVHGLRSPVHRTIDLNYISPDALGRKYLPAGQFFQDLGNGYCRPLARATVTADTGTGTAIIPVNFAQMFIANDVIRSLAPSGKVTITSSSTGWAAGETITVTIEGQDFVYTVQAGDIGGTLTATNTTLAAAIVTLLTAQASQFVVASAVANVVQLYSATNEDNSIAASDTGANGTATASGAVLVGGQIVGTVLTVDPDAKTITLTANSATALMAGQTIGIYGKAIGMTVQALLLDSTISLAGHMPEQGLYTSASVRRELLPYYDALIKADLPEIQAV